MLRAALLACPVVLVFAVSCSGSDSASFTSGGPGSSGTGGSSSSASGASTGGTAAQGGSNAVAGSDATAGKTSTAGSTNTAGSGNVAGNQSTGGKGGAGPNGGSGGTGNTAGNQTGGKGGSGNAGTANAGGAGGTAGPGGAGGAAGDNGGPLCPDLVGSYTITNVDGGLNCNGLNKNATQSIAATEIPCRAHFVSEGANPNANVGVNGAAPLNQNGDFTGATLMFNKTSRNPCSGVWDAGNARLTIKCGGQGDQCTAELERN